MPNIGPMELIIVLVIVLVIFGPKRLPGLGRQLGSGMREFKDSIASKAGRDDDDEPAPGERSLTAAAAPDPVASPAPTTATPVREPAPASTRVPGDDLAGPSARRDA